MPGPAGGKPGSGPVERAIREVSKAEALSAGGSASSGGQSIVGRGVGESLKVPVVTPFVEALQMVDGHLADLDGDVLAVAGVALLPNPF